MRHYSFTLMPTRVGNHQYLFSKYKDYVSKARLFNLSTRRQSFFRGLRKIAENQTLYEASVH